MEPPISEILPKLVLYHLSIGVDSLRSHLDFGPDGAPVAPSDALEGDDEPEGGVPHLYELLSNLLQLLFNLFYFSVIQK